jgi:hypothetical protein
MIMNAMSWKRNRTKRPIDAREFIQDMPTAIEIAVIPIIHDILRALISREIVLASIRWLFPVAYKKAVKPRS